MLVGELVLEEKWPVLGRHERAVGWLRVWADLGRAPRTIDAYARGLVEFLEVCERDGIDPVAASRADVAAYVRELTSRPSRRGAPDQPPWPWTQYLNLPLSRSLTEHDH